ncbi:peptidase [Listeria costaricensis]|uniref:peptidase n=1 Tax=Listeria costaricensis TaxID=2026604 RepID=UPI000C068795|nr:peptidase [Listeria costaricensis]
MGIMMFSMIFMIFAGLLSLAARAVMAIWIYRDAENRGMSGIMWCLLTIFTSVIIVFIIYMLVKKPSFEPGNGKGLMITGIVLTAVSFILTIVMFFMMIFGMVSMDSYYYDYDYDMHDNMMEDYNYDF